MAAVGLVALILNGFLCRSNNVIITKEQVQVYIDCVDTNDNKTIELSEFPDLVFAMATADLNCSHKAPKTGPA